MDPESPAPAPPSRRLGVTLIVVLAAGVAGFLLYRRAAAPSSSVPPATKSPGPAELVAASPVLLNAKATMIADRYRCLCGDCQDTLGKCVCVRDKGSNQMKSLLNRLVDMNKSLSEIDAAMIARYGEPVMAANSLPPAAPPPPGRK